MVKFSWVSLVLLSFGFLNNPEARAANFTLDPVTTFEVGDGFFTEPFDGKGDLDAVFPGNFDTVVLGTFGENSQNAEFDLRNFAVPRNESLGKAEFEVTVASNEVSGLGAPARRPSSLVSRGYIGNGEPDAADFQAGSILDTASVSPEFIEEVLTFDVTTFLSDAVSDRASFVGLSVRAEDLGATILANFEEKGPKLLVTTTANTPDSKSVPEPSSLLGLLPLVVSGGIHSILKKK